VERVGQFRNVVDVGLAFNLTYDKTFSSDMLSIANDQHLSLVHPNQDQMRVPADAEPATEEERTPGFSHHAAMRVASIASTLCDST